MKENLNSKNVTYKNVEFEIFKGMNGNIYVDGLAISKKLKPCLSEWMKENKLLIYNMRTSLGLKMRDFILFSRWLYSDIALCYAKAIGEDFYNFLNTELQEFKEKVNKENQNIMASSIYGNPMYVPGRFEINTTSDYSSETNSSIINFDYQGNAISFEKGKDVMVNLTSMAKLFPEKNLSTIVNSQEINEYVNALTEIKNFSSADLLIVRKGGDVSQQGTWAHRLVAIRVAQKLNPTFAVWVDMKIEELLTTGVSTISNDDEVIFCAMEVLRKRLEASKAEKERLEEQNRIQSHQLQEAAPKVQYVDTVLQSVNTYTSTQVAKELGMREAEKLHKALKEKGIMFKQSGQWLLTADYCGKDYTKPRTTTYTRSDGSQGTNTITVWTEKGRAFLHKLFGTIKAA